MLPIEVIEGLLGSFGVGCDSTPAFRKKARPPLPGWLVGAVAIFVVVVMGAFIFVLIKTVIS
jgi:hypothetical protein